MSKENRSPTLDPPRRIGRPRKAACFRALVEDGLAQDPEVPTLELLNRALLAGYDGGKSAFYALVATMRAGRAAPRGSNALPGECSRHDLVELVVPCAQGSRRRARVFLSRLEYSGWMAASIVRNDGVDAVAHALVDHFQRAGGVPLLACFEWPKLSIAQAAGRPPSDFTTTLAHLALELGVGIELGAQARGRSGPRLSRALRESFLRLLRPIEDDADLCKQLDEWVCARNAQPGTREPTQSIAELLDEERRRLRPVRIDNAALSERLHALAPALVRRTA